MQTAQSGDESRKSSRHDSVPVQEVPRLVSGRLRVAVFGTFYPDYGYVGSATSGLVITLADLPEVAKVRVYCPFGSLLPGGIDTSKIELRPIWKHDDPASLIRTLGSMIRESNEFDVVLFNIFITAFGKKGSSNAVGMLLPSVLSRLTDTPVIAYMHNFVETQDVEKLGYAPGRLARRIAHTLEWLLLRTTQVVVPLQSQRDILRRAFNRDVRNIFLPYLEALVSLRTMPATSSQSLKNPPGTGVDLLLFGLWGPQKDLDGILATLDQISGAGSVRTITLAGTINPHFPGPIGGGETTPRQIKGISISRVGGVREEDVLPLLLSHDALVLPYNATGGISGMLNCAALSGIEVIAYDLPQLREQASLLNESVFFVQKGNAAELQKAMTSAAAHRAGGQRPGRSDMEGRTARTQSAVRNLLLVSGNPSAEGVLSTDPTRSRQ